MTAFTAVARLHADGRAGERRIVAKVTEIAERSGYSTTVTDLPLGQTAVRLGHPPALPTWLRQ